MYSSHHRATMVCRSGSAGVVSGTGTAPPRPFATGGLHRVGRSAGSLLGGGRIDAEHAQDDDGENEAHLPFAPPQRYFVTPKRMRTAT